MTPPNPPAKPAFYDIARIRRAALAAAGVVAPWGVGMAAGQATNGSIASFGAYLLLVSFPTVPVARPVLTLGLAALILSGFACLGAMVTIGGAGFFAMAVAAALAQAVMELRGGPLRLPVALGALAFFLSIEPLPPGGWQLYGGLFLAGTIWAVAVAAVVLPRAPASGSSLPVGDWAGGRFLATAASASLLGALLAGISPSSHPGWLPAAALRVLKPTREQTLRRMKQRGIGSLLGAACGGLLLGWASAPWLHATLVGILVFAMLMIGAKRYGAWTFCLTAVALAFDLGPVASPLPLAFDRVLLTAGGLLVVTALFFLLPRGSAAPSKTVPKVHAESGAGS
ncbi:hypothetical protein K32_23370 [Kaistia sp. 32K]|uniref:FUSC family protein n=1 Tax=Kaistia sp. 32K TaxID=2795690 RepID=UPI0019166E6F|nr:FUSC family protein [Kaistia sp. 32K]BCP53720.1 hypothetical protein K32_23370 [Kaistia sp. 32K]